MNPDSVVYVEVFHDPDGWRWARKDAATHATLVESWAFTEHRYALESATLQNPDASAVVDVDHAVRRPFR